jgi:hypothetical protein
VFRADALEDVLECFLTFPERLGRAKKPAELNASFSRGNLAFTDASSLSESFEIRVNAVYPTLEPAASMQITALVAQ